MNLLGLSPVVAILVGHPAAPAGVARCRGCCSPRAPRCSGSATSTRTAIRMLLGAEVPFPSLGDALYVAHVPGDDGGPADAGPAAQRRRRTAAGSIDGLILDGRPRAAGLGRADGAVPAHGRPVALGQARVGRLPGRRRHPARRRGPARARRRSARAGASTCSSRASSLLLVTDFAYGLLTLHGLYDAPALAGRRLDRLLPALGRGGAASRRWRGSTSRSRAARSCSPGSGSGCSRARRWSRP